MSEKEAAAPAATAAAPQKKKSGLVGALVGLVVTAVLSGGAAYGGARAAAGSATSHDEPKVVIAKPPGPTVQLEPFVANLVAADGKPHAVKVTVAIELAHEAKEDEFKVFIPRVRDATLTYLRGVSFEDLADHGKIEKVRHDLLEKIRGVGAISSDQVLITDLITQ